MSRISLHRRRIFGSVAIALPAAIGAFGRAGARSAATGERAPPFSARDTAGRAIESQDFAGRILVLEWSHPLCPFAGKHYAAGNMQALQRVARNAGAAWFTVISQPPHTIGHVSELEAELLAEQRGSEALATLLDHDTALARTFDARATPHLFIIDRRGVLAYAGGMDSIASTAIDDIERAVPYARLAIEAVISRAAVPYPVTRPYGCPVKHTTA